MRARRSVHTCAGPDEEPDWEPDWKPRGAAKSTRVSQMVRPGAEVPLDFVQ